MFKPEIQLTADGSHTLFIPDMDEHYHSVNGAVQESNHVYIEAGLGQCRKTEIRVLELGFGTGLNAFLTCCEAEKRKLQVSYTAIEKYPLPEEVYCQLNYGNLVSDEYSAIFQQIHASPWEDFVNITPFFSLKKENSDFTHLDFDDRYDVVYYDAFAPDKQTDVWSQEIFDKLFNSMSPDGVLTTYCAKGSVRRMIQNAGFLVERLPGPPGKREMLRARKEARKTYIS